MTPIAEALKPYTLYLIYAQIFLLSLAIFVGAMLIIRRLWRRESVDGGLIQDRDKLASEIHEEVLRLQNLRNRLDSSYILKGDDIAASPIASAFSERDSTEAQGPATAQAPEPTPNPAELEEKVREATQYLTQEIAELTQRLSQAEEKLKAAPEAGAGSVAAAPAENSAEHAETVKELKDLREKLEDYQAFEDEIALVKQYKAEIERLKALLEGSQSSAGISEADIANLFAEMGGSQTSSPAEAPVETPAETPAEAPSETVIPAAPPELAAEDLVFAADPADAPVTKGFVAEAQIEEPKLPAAINEDNAEALAELGEDDQLMAEFEKVLGTGDQEKT